MGDTIMSLVGAHGSSNAWVSLQAASVGRRSHDSVTEAAGAPPHAGQRTEGHPGNRDLRPPILSRGTIPRGAGCRFVGSCRGMRPAPFCRRAGSARGGLPSLAHPVVELGVAPVLRLG